MKNKKRKLTGAQSFLYGLYLIGFFIWLLMAFNTTKPQVFWTMSIPAIGAVFLYTLPAYIACKKEHLNAGVIILVNLALGWTLIGYVLTFFWALSSNNQQVIIAPERTASEELKELANLLNSGAISQSEFDTLKSKIV